MVFQVVAKTSPVVTGTEAGDAAVGDVALSQLVAVAVNV